ncbi:MAG: PepSY domain-containing protein [Thermoplasmata archaeon]|jgi:hypothetical protein|nr:hypothetical protein [Thermoplasmatales archaeon]PMP75518.1 MAG: hypothetical protein C0180_01145 [Aciduliprofundum sp.]
MNLVKAMLAVAIVAVLGISAIAIAHTGNTVQSATLPRADTQNSTVNEQFPNYTGSISVPENSSDDNLSSLAKISPGQAASIVLNNSQFSGGKVLNVTLENENGYLVYSVIVSVSNSTYEVKVDAGNGKILAIEKCTEVQEEFGAEDQ